MDFGPKPLKRNYFNTIGGNHKIKSVFNILECSVYIEEDWLS